MAEPQVNMRRTAYQTLAPEVRDSDHEDALLAAIDRMVQDRRTWMDNRF